MIYDKKANLNGLDFSVFTPPVHYDIEYKTRDGGQGGLMQDGSMREDILARKAVITLYLPPLNDENMGWLLQAIWKDPSELEYFDLIEQRYITISTLRGQLATAQDMGQGTDRNNYWYANTLTLEEA